MQHEPEIAVIDAQQLRGCLRILRYGGLILAASLSALIPLSLLAGTFYLRVFEAEKNNELGGAATAVAVVYIAFVCDLLIAGLFTLYMVSRKLKRQKQPNAT